MLEIKLKILFSEKMNEVFITSWIDPPEPWLDERLFLKYLSGTHQSQSGLENNLSSSVCYANSVIQVCCTCTVF